MSTLLVHHDGATRAVPLASSTLVGRAWSCLARIDDPAVPLYWIEIRWRGTGWTWRILAGEDHTAAPPAAQTDGWRPLVPSTGVGTQRVRLGQMVAVEIVEGGPPQPFVIDLATGVTVRGEQLSTLVEFHGESMIPLEAEGDPSAALPEGGLFYHLGRAWRAHGGAHVEPTHRARVNLARPGARLAVNVTALRASLLHDDAEVVISGEPVRALAIYHEARLADPAGGWLDALEAWAAWRELGGNVDSPSERVAYDRARARTAFARQGVAAVERIFEVRRDRDGVRVRLAVTPEP